jgi:hypothetical protein
MNHSKKKRRERNPKNRKTQLNIRRVSIYLKLLRQLLKIIKKKKSLI